MIPAFFIVLTFFAGTGENHNLRVKCPDLVCVGKVVEAAEKQPEIHRIRVFTKEPVAFGPEGSPDPALTDYLKG